MSFNELIAKLTSSMFTLRMAMGMLASENVLGSTHPRVRSANTRFINAKQKIEIAIGKYWLSLPEEEQEFLKKLMES